MSFTYTVLLFFMASRISFCMILLMAYKSLLLALNISACCVASVSLS